MQILQKERLLFLVQCDNLDGEQIAPAMESLYEAGVKNVQLLSSLTKKGRPGYVFLIDGDEASADAVESVILKELGVTGWHRIGAQHRYVAVDILRRTVQLQTVQGTQTAEVLYKQSSADPQRIRPEYESCRKIRALLAEQGVFVSLPLVRQKLTEAFTEDADGRKTLFF
ncbi:MAG: LarC family nickel insertion protein [Clostridiales bacterium]|nr:LarC family nickel insertion protein [Clostridiales bacterium]